MLDWYKCQADSGAVEFETIGVLLFAGGANNVIPYEIKGIMEFRNPVSASLGFQRLKKLLVPQIRGELVAEALAAKKSTRDGTSRP